MGENARKAGEMDKPLTFYEASARLSAAVHRLNAAVLRGLRLRNPADRQEAKALDADRRAAEWRRQVTDDDG